MKLWPIFLLFPFLAFARTEQQWRAHLGLERFKTMRLKGTDPAFIGPYCYPPQNEGTYHCAACNLELFLSHDQYDAGSGYPCFTKSANSTHVYYEEDYTLPFKRYEVLCRTCDSHLGHLFHDGPPPKYFRYCINSTALQYLKSQK